MYPSLRDFLQHIKEEREFLVNATKGKSYPDIFDDEILKCAIIRSIEIIGEAK